MSDNPLISIVIPVYKVEQYLRECVDSVIAQTYKNLDIILVDDGSPDKCPAMCDEYAAKDSRVRVIHRSNGGLSAARNSGIDIARGEYITFIDSDDYVVHEYIGSLWQMIRETDAGISCCMYTIDVEKLSDTQAHDFRIVSPYDAVIMALSFREIVRNAWGKLYRTEIFTDRGILYPEGIVSEDLAVMPEVFSAAGKIAYTRDAMYFYRMNEESIMHTSFALKNMDYYNACSMAEESAKRIFPDKWQQLSKYFTFDRIQNTMKMLRDLCLSGNEDKATISELTGKITLKDAVMFMTSSAKMPKKLAALLVAIMPSLALKIIKSSAKYKPAYN